MRCLFDDPARGDVYWTTRLQAAATGGAEVRRFRDGEDEFTQGDLLIRHGPIRGEVLEYARVIGAFIIAITSGSWHSDNRSSAHVYFRRKPVLRGNDEDMEFAHCFVRFWWDWAERGFVGPDWSLIEPPHVPSALMAGYLLSRLTEAGGSSLRDAAHAEYCALRSRSGNEMVEDFRARSLEDLLRDVVEGDVSTFGWRRP